MGVSGFASEQAGLCVDMKRLGGFPALFFF